MHCFGPRRRQCSAFIRFTERVLGEFAVLHNHLEYVREVSQSVDLAILSLTG